MYNTNNLLIEALLKIKNTTKKASYTGCFQMSHRGFEPLTL